MNPNQAEADNRIFNFDDESLKRGLAMSVEERLQWAEEMMILGWQVQARIAKEREQKVQRNSEEYAQK